MDIQLATCVIIVNTSDSSISQLYLSLLKKCKHYLDTFTPPVGAVSNRTGLECLINSKIHYSSPQSG